MGTKREDSGLRSPDPGGGAPAAPLPQAWGCCAGLQARLCSQAPVPGPEGGGTPHPRPREEKTPRAEKKAWDTGWGTPCHPLHNLAVQSEGRFQVRLSHTATPHPQKILEPP